LTLPPENLCGLLGSLCLLFAPARDQILRHRAWLANRRAAGTTGAARWWDAIRDGYERQRNRWDFWDSATMAAGAILLAASYVIGANG